MFQQKIQKSEIVECKFLTGLIFCADMQGNISEIPHDNTDAKVAEIYKS